MKYLLLLAALALAGCDTVAPTRIEYKAVPYAVPAPCPDKDTAASLKANRPKPLRDQPKPATAEERSAKMNAQLGRYEAEGGWGDKVVSALDRCQEVVAPPP